MEQPADDHGPKKGMIGYPQVDHRVRGRQVASRIGPRGRHTVRWTVMRDH
jgi:hypothetical protein